MDITSHLRTTRRAAIAGAAALAALACSRELEPVLRAPDSTRIVHFRASEADTRAVFGEATDGSRPTLWTSNEQHVKLSLNHGSALIAGITPSSDFRTATFSAQVDFTNVTGPYTYYAVSPASAALALSPSRTAWKVTIPCEQTPSESSVAESAIILASKSASFSQAAQVNVVDLYFNHLTAYGRMSLSNFSPGNNVTVSYIELTTETPIVGDWYWKTSDASITDYGASSTLKINTSSTSDIWFACAPVDMSNKKMTVRVYTRKNNEYFGVYTKQVTFPAERQFEAGKAAVFTVNMAAAEFDDSPVGDFALVTDASTLQVGDEIIIANVEANYALGQAMLTTPPFRQGVEISSFGTVLTSIGDATILTLEEGSTNGTFALKTGDHYLTTSFSSDYSLSESSEITAESSWAISISGGEATIVAQDGEDSWYLCFYAGGHYFGGFVTGYSVVNPVIYRRKASGEVTEDPILAKTAYGCYLGTGYERALVSGSDQVTRSYNSNDVLTYTLLNTTSVEEVEIFGYTKSLVKGDRVVITVNWHQGTTPVLSESYTMKVVKEEGPKVWLSDGAGKGVVIKK